MSLRIFLSRLIWICTLPLLLLAAYLSINAVRATQSAYAHAAYTLAQNVATSVDQDLNARILALRMLANSPLAASSVRRKDFYREAQAFDKDFGGQVILADRDLNMEFNTRVPYGNALPKLPRPRGHSAASTALATGAPAIGDMVLGPVAKMPLVAIAVPARDNNGKRFLLLATFTTNWFQQRLDRVILPSSWRLMLTDSIGDVIARRVPGDEYASAVTERHTARSSLSNWSVIVELPRGMALSPMAFTAAALIGSLALAVVVGHIGGKLASRRLAKSVAMMAEKSSAGTYSSGITEIDAVHKLLNDAEEHRGIAERALRESAREMRLVADKAPALVAHCDRELRYRFVNRQYAALFGKHPAELVGKHVRDVFDVAAYKLASPYIEAALAGQSVNYDFTKQTPVGNRQIFQASYAPEQDDAGHTIGFIVVIIDVTQRKQTEDALRASRDLLQSVVEHVPIRIFWKDIDSRYLGCNSLFARDAGFSRPEDIHGKNDFQMAWRDHASQYVADDKLVMSTGKFKLGFEEPQTRPDGHTIWLRTSKVPLHKPDGTVDGMLGIYDDITDQRLAAEALRRSTRALRTLSAGNEALVHISEEDKLLQASCRVVVDMGGYREATMFVPLHDRAKSISVVAHAGPSLKLLESLHLSWADNERGQSIVARAIRSGVVQLSQDVRADSALMAWHGASENPECLTMAVLPIGRPDDTVLAVLCICASEPNAFDDDELRLLKELASNIAFGITTLHIRSERDNLLRAHLKSSETIKATLTETIRAIARTVEKRDPYTAGHQQRVAELAVAIGEANGLDDDSLEGLRLGATIHDIGKIYVPAEILNRPGRLTDAEFAIIKTHPQVGYDIVKDVHFPWPVAQMILQHHERLDGTGYPSGLKGDEILREARIIAVADVVEAMSSHRPYRPGLGYDKAFDEIKGGRGKWYDPDAVDACLSLFRNQSFTWAKAGS
jgi:PAS domain S-box-containing protein